MADQKHRIYTTSVASVYPHYVAKAERKGRTKAEVDEILCWLTGYGQNALDAHLKKQTDFENFFAAAPALNPARRLITGVICGVKVQDIEEPLMQEIRYADKLIDELAKGKAMTKILRAGCPRQRSERGAFDNLRHGLEELNQPGVESVHSSDNLELSRSNAA